MYRYIDHWSMTKEGEGVGGDTWGVIRLLILGWAEHVCSPVWYRVILILISILILIIGWACLQSSVIQSNSACILWKANIHYILILVFFTPFKSCSIVAQVVWKLFENERDKLKIAVNSNLEGEEFQNQQNGCCSIAPTFPALDLRI